MADAKADQLLAAATAGNVAKIRQLLASGSPLEATDINRNTPAMLAAQGGHAEAFRVLVEAGANLNALAFSQRDMLEMAARGGNVEIIRFLLNQGMPVNGHWQPRVEALRRLGHPSPLIEAATGGHVEAVQVLLEAGADRNVKYQGMTALQLVRRILAGDLAGEAARQAYREIARVLDDTPDRNEPSVNATTLEVEKFATNAQQAAYAQLHETLEKQCGEGRPWQPIPDHGIAVPQAFAFTLRKGKRKALDELQGQARNAGYLLVLAEPWEAGADAKLVLFPTSDKFAVVAAVGTEGANYGVTTADVIAWLRELDQENAFVLHLCNHEMVGGIFLGPLRGAKKLAERIIELCPSVLDEAFETPQQLARALSKRGSFLMRWD